jgi:hypothetical protein
MIRLAAAIVISCLLSAAVLAAEVKIGDVPVTLPSLPGHCEMDVVQASDADLIAKLHTSLRKAGNRLLLLTADCKELKEWRNGKRPALEHMAEYQTILALENTRLPDEPEKVIKTYCDQMNALANQATAQTMAGVQDRAEQAVKVVTINEMKSLGALPVPDEPLVCYAATLHKFKVETGEEFTQATVIAAAVVKGKLLLSYLFAPYVGRDTLMHVLTKQRANVRQLRHANRN